MFLCEWLFIKRNTSRDLNGAKISDNYENISISILELSKHDQRNQLSFACIHPHFCFKLHAEYMIGLQRFAEEG